MAEVLAFSNFYGKRADGTNIKNIVPQFDGSSRGGDNCAPASEASRAIRNQQNKRPAKGSPWQPTGKSIRAQSGDVSGGMTPFQTTGVTKRIYGIPNDIRIVYWADLIAWLRKGGSATLLIGYRPVAEAGKSGSPGFYGNHSDPAVGIRGTGTSIEILMADPLYDGRRRGIPKGPQWINLSVMKKAAGALSLSSTRKMSTAYPGKVYCSFSTRTYTPPVAPFKLYPGATKLLKPRIYTPIYENSLLRKTPRRISTNHIGAVDPGFKFQAYQYIINSDGKWIGNKTGTAWMLFAGVKFVSYI